MNKKEYVKIIMVNSFKGGTGKTSVALSHCLYEWKRSNACSKKDEIYYENIFFVDIDRLGTSMSYYLFPDEGKPPVYFEKYKKREAAQVCNKVDLSGDNNNSELHAVLLNPVANRRQDYSIHGRMQQHTRIYDTMFLEDILTFIEECTGMGKNCLFVIDCSPGLSEMECHLLDKLYMMKERLKKKYYFEVEELYVTTFESGQIQKTIECLNDSRDLLFREGREVSIVLNDVQNCIGVSKGNDKFHVEWEEVAKNILKQLQDKASMKIRYKKYEEKQMKAGIVGNVQSLDNTIDAYMLLKEYREDYISEDRMDVK